MFRLSVIACVTFLSLSFIESGFAVPVVLVQKQQQYHNQTTITDKDVFINFIREDKNNLTAKLYRSSLKWYEVIMIILNPYY